MSGESGPPSPGDRTELQPESSQAKAAAGRRITGSGDIEDTPLDDWLSLFERYRKTAREIHQ